MANPNPAVVQTSQSGEPANVNPTLKPFSDNLANSYTTHHKRRFVHYVDNGMLQANRGLNYNRNDGWVYRDGWYWIPYMHLKASVSPTDWAGHTAMCSAVKIKELGFKIIKYLPTVQKSKTVTGTTELVNEVFKDAELMCMKDDHHFLFDITKDDVFSDVNSLNSCNSNMELPVPEKMDDGMLRQTKFIFGDNFQRDNEKIDKFKSFTFFNDWPIDFIPTGGTWGHTWKGPDRLYALSAGPAGFQPNVIVYGENVPHGNQIESLPATGMNINSPHGPPSCLVKVFPILGKTGPIMIDATMVVEYTSTLEWFRRPTNSLNVLQQGTYDPSGNSAWANANNRSQWNFLNQRDLINYNSFFKYAPLIPPPPSFSG